MKLYEEIIFLKHFYNGKWCVENVIGYYEPLIPPQEINQHYFWANFIITPPLVKFKQRYHDGTQQQRYEFKGFDLTKYKGVDKRKLIRNCVEPLTGKHILDCMLDPIKLQGELL